MSPRLSPSACTSTWQADVAADTEVGDDGIELILAEVEGAERGYLAERGREDAEYLSTHRWVGVKVA